MDEMDRDELLRLLELRLDAITQDDEAQRRYIEGRIDGHCLQNAISASELVALTTSNGYRIDWQTAMAVVET